MTLDPDEKERVIEQVAALVDIALWQETGQLFGAILRRIMPLEEQREDFLSGRGRRRLINAMDIEVDGTKL